MIKVKEGKHETSLQKKIDLKIKLKIKKKNN